MTDIKTLTFLVSDIEGSSAKWERHPGAMRKILARHDAILRQAVTGAGGRIFKTTGDGVNAVFKEAGAAAAAALRAQCDLAREDFSDVDGISVRIAVHLGPAEARGGDYFGPTLNRAARLAGIAHGGQIVIANAAADSAQQTGLPAQAALRNLGEHRLKDLDRPEQVYQLLHPALQDAFPALRSLNVRPNNLPLQPATLIGRDEDVAAVADLLERHRLVTLTGAGGIGKTRLSIEIGAAMLPDFPDGVWLVELAPRGAASEVASAAAEVLKLSTAGSRAPDEAVALHLKDRRLLLILDNCEHLLDGVARFTDTLLRQAPHIRMLATSREVLNVNGEKTYATPVLAVPAAPAGLTAAQAMGYSAIALFVRRAQLVVDGFALNDGTAPIIGSICRRLDGIALAIELAASRLRHLAPAELLERLNDRFGVLTGGSRAALPRHQTMRALIDWSYGLLSGAEQAALRRLAIFADTFSLAGAAGVIAGDPIAARDVFDHVAALIDKSLVSTVPDTGPETRYRLLESTRQYGLERLDEQQERALFQQRVVDYLIIFYREAACIISHTPHRQWCARFDPDSYNAVAAINWALGDGGNMVSAQELVSVARGTIAQRTIDWSGWQEICFRNIGPATPKDVEAWLLLFQVWGAGIDNNQAAEHARRAIKLFEELGDQPHVAIVTSCLMLALARPGDARESQPVAKSLIAILPALPVKTRGIVLFHIGYHAYIMSDLETAETLVIQAAAASRQMEHFINLIDSILLHAATRSAKRDYAGALALSHEACAICRSNRTDRCLVYALMDIATYSILLDKRNNPRAALHEAISLLPTFNAERELSICAEIVALLAAQEGDMATALKLAGFAGHYFVHQHVPRIVYQLRVREVLFESVAVAEAETASLMAEGAGWTMEHAIAAALKV